MAREYEHLSDEDLEGELVRYKGLIDRGFGPAIALRERFETKKATRASKAKADALKERKQTFLETESKAKMERAGEAKRGLVVDISRAKSAAGFDVPAESERIEGRGITEPSGGFEDFTEETGIYRTEAPRGISEAEPRGFLGGFSNIGARAKPLSAKQQADVDQLQFSALPKESQAAILKTATAQKKATAKEAAAKLKAAGKKAEWSPGDMAIRKGSEAYFKGYYAMPYLERSDEDKRRAGVEMRKLGGLHEKYEAKGIQGPGPSTDVAKKGVDKAIDVTPKGAGFDPEGTGYDDAAATKAGMKRDAKGHLGSVAELPQAELKRLGLPEPSYLMLKGRKHKTWNLAVEAENARGFEVVRGPDGRYYSIPMQSGIGTKKVRTTIAGKG